MKRIQPTGCGYNTYICSGLPAIKSDFIKGSTAIPMPIVSGGTFTYDKSALPQQLEGFVMTLVPVLDMDVNGSTIEVPELECRTELDPFKVTDLDTQAYRNTDAQYTGNPETLYDGFLDFYGHVTTYRDTVYIRVDGGTDTLVYVDGSTSPVIGSTCTFTADEIVGPGILEPMVDTDFSPITVETIPAPDAGFDMTTYLFDTWEAWRGLVEERLNNLHDYVIPIGEGGLNGMLNLENAKNMSGTCYNFQIQVTGSTQVVGGSDLPTPRYIFVGPQVGIDILAGLVKIDGTDYKVYSPNMGGAHAGVAATGPGFDAYLDVFNYIDDNALVLGATIAIAELGDPPESTTEDISGFTHRKFEYIGSVKKVISNAEVPFDGGTAYKLYEIEQGDCIYEINLEGGTGGSSTCSCEYNGPFKVIAGSTISEVAITGPDTNSQGTTQAGYICINGTSCALTGTGTAATGFTGSGNYDVYANCMADGTVNYAFERDTTSIPAPYSVRLAKITGTTALYNIELSGDLQDNPALAGHIMTGLDDTSMISGGTVIQFNPETHEYRFQMAALGSACEVRGSTCTGKYQMFDEGDTLVVSAIEACGEILQIHHGDIYIDGRWS